MEPILLRADRAGERADQLLARLGAPERMRARSVDIQVFLSFFLPLALALVHAAVGMTAWLHTGNLILITFTYA